MTDMSPCTCPEVGKSSRTVLTEELSFQRFINSWENYYLEILMAAGILVYFINFFTGKSKNARVASAWFDAHKELLETNFALVGDDGAKDLDDVETQLVKESEHGFVLWCSGRVGCESMLVSSHHEQQERKT